MKIIILASILIGVPLFVFGAAWAYPIEVHEMPDSYSEAVNQYNDG